MRRLSVVYGCIPMPEVNMAEILPVRYMIHRGHIDTSLLVDNQDSFLNKNDISLYMQAFES